MDNLRIVPWTSEYFETTVAHYIHVFSAEPWNDELTVPQINAYVTALTAMNTFLGYCLFQEDSSEPIGFSLDFIKPWYQGTEYVIDTFLITIDHQGKGAGAVFIQLIKEALRQKNIPTILLDTESNMPAADFYRKNGFKPLPDNVTFYLSLE